MSEGNLFRRQLTVVCRSRGSILISVVGSSELIWRHLSGLEAHAYLVDLFELIELASLILKVAGMLQWYGLPTIICLLLLEGLLHGIKVPFLIN